MFILLKLIKIMKIGDHWSDRKIMAAFFAAAVLIYIPGIWWGLPHATAPDRIFAWGNDELGPLGPIAELYSVFIDSKSFDPKSPLFHYFIQALFVGPYMFVLLLTGNLSLSQAVTEYPFGLTDPVNSLAVMTLLARMVSLLMAAAVVVISFKTVTLLWNRRTGILTAIFVLLSYHMFYYSRTSNVDMGALFWTSLGILILAICIRNSLTPQRAILLGTFAALATATKDASYAAFLIIALFIVPQHIHQQRKMGHNWPQSFKSPLIGLFSSLGVYIIASGLIFNFDRYLLHIDFMLHGSKGGLYYSTPATLNGYISILGKTFNHIIATLGFPVIIFAIIGLILCATRTPRYLILALPIPGILFGVILSVRFVQFRFVIIMAYVLTFFAAYVLTELINSRKSMFCKAGYCFTILAISWQFIHGADFTYQMINDSRYKVSAWLNKNARSGDRVGYYGAPLKLPQLDHGIVTCPMPGQIPSPRMTTKCRDNPEFVLVIPQQDFEPVHEFSLPEHIYRNLLDGSSGYQLVLNLQTRSLFSNRPVPFVNPPVKVFVKKPLKSSTSNY